MNADEATIFIDRVRTPWMTDMDETAWRVVLADWELDTAIERLIVLLTRNQKRDVGPAMFNPEVEGGRPALVAWARIVELSRGQGLRALRSVVPADQLWGKALKAMSIDEVQLPAEKARWRYVDHFERLAAEGLTGVQVGLPTGNAELETAPSWSPPDEATRERIKTAREQAREAAPSIYKARGVELGQVDEAETWKSAPAGSHLAEVMDDLRRDAEMGE